jgi:hypothetical protein
MFHLTEVVNTVPFVIVTEVPVPLLIKISMFAVGALGDVGVYPNIFANDTILF